MPVLHETSTTNPNRYLAAPAITDDYPLNQP